MQANETQAGRRVVQELIKRQRAARRTYGVPDLARESGVSRAHLTNVANGKRRLTLDLALRLVEALGIGPDERTAVLRPLLGATAVDATEAGPTRVLRDDEFRLICDWYHYAILNLTEVVDAPHDAAGFATRLGISEQQASLAIQRLKRMGLLETEAGRLKQARVSCNTPKDVPSTAVRQYHRQTLHLAQRALDRCTLEERYFGARSVPFDPADVPKAKAMIREFLAKLSEELAAGRELRRVYHLSVQMFPLDSCRGGA